MRTKLAYLPLSLDKRMSLEPKSTYPSSQPQIAAFLGRISMCFSSKRILKYFKTCPIYLKSGLRFGWVELFLLRLLNIDCSTCWVTLWPPFNGYIARRDVWHASTKDIFKPFSNLTISIDSASNFVRHAVLEQRWSWGQVIKIG